MKKIFIAGLMLFVFTVSIFLVASPPIFGVSATLTKSPPIKTTMPATLTCPLTGVSSLIIGETGSWTATVAGGNPPYSVQWQYTGSEISLGPQHQMLKTTEVFVHAFETKGRETLRFTVTDRTGTIACAYFSCIIGK